MTRCVCTARATGCFNQVLGAWERKAAHQPECLNMSQHGFPPHTVKFCHWLSYSSPGHISFLTHCSLVKLTHTGPTHTFLPKPAPPVPCWSLYALNYAYISQTAFLLSVCLCEHNKFSSGLQLSLSKHLCVICCIYVYMLCWFKRNGCLTHWPFMHDGSDNAKLMVLLEQAT